MRYETFPFPTQSTNFSDKKFCNVLLQKYEEQEKDDAKRIVSSYTYNDVLILQGDPKEIRWANRNFSDGSVTWKMNGANAITVTDKIGDNMVIQLDEIE